MQRKTQEKDAQSAMGNKRETNNLEKEKVNGKNTKA